MVHEPLDWARARVLISNDDGIHAPGLAVLERVARALGAEVWVVAPETEQSGAGHSLTLRRPLRIRGLDERHYAVDGTPTDAVLLAVRQLMAETPPTVVLSGINRGGNLGEDVTYSGTIAAAMEGALLGLPAIAVSQVTDDRTRTRWETAERWTGEVLRRLSGQTWPRNVLLNVNVPDRDPDAVTGIEATFQGRRKIGGEIVRGTDPRGVPYYWIGAQREEHRTVKGSDLEAVDRGAVAVTPLGTDLTHAATLKALTGTWR